MSVFDELREMHGREIEERKKEPPIQVIRRTYDAGNKIRRDTIGSFHGKQYRIVKFHEERDALTEEVLFTEVEWVEID